MSSSSGTAIPAWKLRMMQQQKGPTQAPGQSSSGMPSSLDKNNTRQPIPKHSTSSSSSSQNPSEALAKLKKKMEAATLDPNLPPAFKVAMKGRLAFARQQERRKANDTWESLNSSHINAESMRPVDYVDTDDNDDSSFASMGEDSYERGGHDDDRIIEEGDEWNED